MVESAPHEVTLLLKAWSAGDEGAGDRLARVVYRELHVMARRYMAGERSGHSLQTTALVNEVYLRLVNAREVDRQSRAHFLGVCAQSMRCILTDFARSRRSKKRGSGHAHVPFEDAHFAGRAQPTDIAALDYALKALAAMDERKSRVVELRFFGGLTAEETAELLKVSPETVLRDWKLAKVWLLRELGKHESHGT